MNLKFDKSKLPSRQITEGPKRAAHRSFFYAMGVSREAMNRTIIGVAKTWNETAPCNITLRRQVGVAKAGVEEAGGTPRDFCIGHVDPEAAVGGPIGLAKNGDEITIDADSGEISIALSDAKLETRRRECKLRESDCRSGVLWKYAATVGPAYKGAVTHPGGAAAPQVMPAYR